MFYIDSSNCKGKVELPPGFNTSPLPKTTMESLAFLLGAYFYYDIHSPLPPGFNKPLLYLKLHWNLWLVFQVHIYIMAFITPLPPGFKTSLLYLRVETKMEIFGLSFQVHVSIMAFIHPHLMGSTNTYPLPETTMESLACLFRCIFLFWHSFPPPPPLLGIHSPPSPTPPPGFNTFILYLRLQWSL